eukprot:CAMPEP_0172763108 /NCGR_PEP_ID=MMETSP1074-20121228/174738_1 /TAXON_ID=2916 /ORGANISM="Ceratium fusus, Strain PA161109" /LENGTH=54 /DNA_ID=CAMNT_0013597629 /DNA_START=162 /DNA_END=323 /DNA_ORIENTATION=-
MSNWTMEEVRQLDGKNGGGNAAASARWFAHCRESQHPQPNGPQDALKEFIRRAY